MLNWHPLFVHYPIALLTSAVFLEVLWLVFRKESLRHAMMAALVLGAVGVVIATATGLQAEATVPHEVPGGHELMETHGRFALISSALAVVLAVWQLWLAQRFVRLRAVFAVGLLALLGLISYTGYLGGDLVYRCGVGGKGGLAFQAAPEGGHHHHHGGEPAEEDGSHHDDDNGAAEPGHQH